MSSTNLKSFPPSRHLFYLYPLNSTTDIFWAPLKYLGKNISPIVPIHHTLGHYKSTDFDVLIEYLQFYFLLILKHQLFIIRDVNENSPEKGLAHHGSLFNHSCSYLSNRHNLKFNVSKIIINPWCLFFLISAAVSYGTELKKTLNEFNLSWT